MPAFGFFLLDPDNEPFALGISPRLPAGKQGCLLLFFGIFVLAGLLIAVEVGRQWAHFAILSSSYAETQGQVLGHRIEADEGASYYVTYRFVADDQAHTVEEGVSESTYHSVEEGQSLTVRYAQNDPTITTIEYGRVGGLLALTVFCLAWNGFVFLVTRPFVREILKRRKLARYGQLVEGKVARCSGHKDSDGDFVVDVRYSFCSPQTGARLEDKDSQIRKDLEDGPLPPPGTPVHVLYLDDETFMVL